LEEKAFKDIIIYVESQRDKQIGIDGYTYSNPVAFHGRWWSSEAEDWIGDTIVLLMVDYKIALTDKRFSLAEEVAGLKKVIQEAYARYGRPQEEIWIVTHHVTRHT
jgi:hypothetical protein